MKNYFRLALPIILLSSLWGVNTALQTAILGHLSSAAIAANRNLDQIFKCIPAGLKANFGHWYKKLTRE